MVDYARLWHFKFKPLILADINCWQIWAAVSAQVTQASRRAMSSSTNKTSVHNSLECWLGNTYLKFRSESRWIRQIIDNIPIPPTHKLLLMFLEATDLKAVYNKVVEVQRIFQGDSAEDNEKCGYKNSTVSVSWGWCDTSEGCSQLRQFMLLHREQPMSNTWNAPFYMLKDDHALSTMTRRWGHSKMPPYFPPSIHMSWDLKALQTSFGKDHFSALFCTFHSNASKGRWGPYSIFTRQWNIFLHHRAPRFNINVQPQRLTATQTPPLALATNCFAVCETILSLAEISVSAWSPVKVRKEWLQRHIIAYNHCTCMTRGLYIFGGLIMDGIQIP